MTTTVEKLVALTTAGSLKEARTLIDSVGEQYKDLEIFTPEDYERVKKGRNEVRSMRTGLDKAAKAAKKPHQEAMKAIDSLKVELQILVAKYEEPIKARVESWEAKQRELDEARARQETARVKRHTDRIARIKEIPGEARNKGTVEIAAALEELGALAPVGADPSFEEYLDEAEAAWGVSMELLQSDYERAEEIEKLKAELAASTPPSPTKEEGPAASPEKPSQPGELPPGESLPPGGPTQAPANEDLATLQARTIWKAPSPAKQSQPPSTDDNGSDPMEFRGSEGHSWEIDWHRNGVFVCLTQGKNGHFEQVHFSAADWTVIRQEIDRRIALIMLDSPIGDVIKRHPHQD